MAHTPAPDTTLTAEQLTDARNDALQELKGYGEDRHILNAIPDQLERVVAIRASNTAIRELVDHAHHTLGMSKVEIAGALGLSRQGLHNILNAKV